MMPVVNGVMLAVGNSPAASIVAKATVIMALGLIAAWLARRSRAAVRHALLAAAFGVLLMLPIASIVAPPFRIAVPAEVPVRVVPASVVPTAASTRATVGVTLEAPRSPGLSPSALLLPVWIAGTALFLLPVAMGLWQVRSLRRSALPWRHGQSLTEGLALDAGIRRRVAVLLHEALPGPMTCGVVHPAIVLPPDAQTWEGDDLNRAIVHELEHVRRGDWVSHCLARAMCAVYWFHPLAWIAWRQLALEAERSCDDAVLRRSDATAYADQLVGVAQRLSLAAKSTAAKSPLLAMANRADLAKRVGAVLDSRQRRGRAGAVLVVLACTAAAVLVLTISPLTMVAAPQAAAGLIPTTLYSANTLLVIDAVTVSDKNGRKIERLSAGDFLIAEDGMAQVVDICEFQNLPDRPYYILGYYTRNHNADGKFRKIGITLKGDATARLEYRPGYYGFSPDTARLIGVGNADAETAGPHPVLMHKKAPEYSEEARKAKYQGTVILNLEIDASGRVANVSVTRSLGLGLDEKATDAVKQWTFRPAMKDGKPVTVHAQVAANFRLL